MGRSRAVKTAANLIETPSRLDLSIDFLSIKLGSFLLLRGLSGLSGEVNVCKVVTENLKLVCIGICSINVGYKGVWSRRSRQPGVPSAAG